MRKKKIFVVFLLLFSILLTSFGFWTYQMLYSPNILVDKEDQAIIIRRGETFKQVQDLFYEENIVNDLVSFSFLARLMNYDTKVKPGRYVMRANMNNLEAIRMLRAGKQEPVNITFNNVRLIEDLGEKITRNILLTEAEFNAALVEYLANNQDGFDEKTIVGMFIPNTYEVYFDIEGDELIERMNREYHNFWNEERLAKAEAIGLSPREVSVLASIVQAESIKGDESPVIAGLYMNRLNTNMALEADPTLVFAAGDFTIKRVLNKHKEIDSPYNTYKYYGLPPGPINNPGKNSILAALYPEKTKYLFFVATGDGGHTFSRTAAEHARAKAKFNKIRRKIRKQKQQLN
jgi:UPF0755 protein